MGSRGPFKAVVEVQKASPCLETRYVKIGVVIVNVDEGAGYNWANRGSLATSEVRPSSGSSMTRSENSRESRLSDVCGLLLLGPGLALSASWEVRFAWCDLRAAAFIQLCVG